MVKAVYHISLRFCCDPPQPIFLATMTREREREVIKVQNITKMQPKTKTIFKMGNQTIFKNLVTFSKNFKVT